jgi:hypothetical protein
VARKSLSTQRHVGWAGGEGGTLSEFATRLSGSSDLYQHDGRKPSASINFITCHGCLRPSIPQSPTAPALACMWCSKIIKAHEGMEEAARGSPAP